MIKYSGKRDPSERRENLPDLKTADSCFSQSVHENTCIKMESATTLRPPKNSLLSARTTYFLND